MRIRTWCGTGAFKRSSSRHRRISRHPAYRAMQFLGQIAQATQGKPPPVWLSNRRPEECWSARRPFLKRSNRNQDGDVNLVFLELSLNAQARTVPPISRHTPGLFSAIVQFPLDRSTSIFIIQEKLETNLRQTAVQRRHKHLLRALDSRSVGFIGRWCLRPQEDGEQNKIDTENNTPHARIRHHV